ncbi:MAG: exodeoxyribonuclease VII large subunit [Actinobacteria bacterium]|nr:exodeoxyribonuclease VII large subunit [Actinomycetota bacterium]MCB9390541.1 exodeoxyribonuclease VII large subunit [Acidimicrobiia bacterium]
MDSLDTLSVSQLHTQIRAALDGCFPDEIWIRGEVQGLFHSRAGHTYFDLVEHKGGVVRGRQAQVVGKISVVLFRGSRFLADRIMKRASFELSDGVEVRIGGRVGSFAERGSLQFVMRTIDPTFTFGQIAEAKDRLLRTLAAEGLIGANADRQLPEVPLRIGLVTSVGSDAYEDFLAELGRHRYNWQIRVFDARVQGADAPATLSRAIARAGKVCPVVAVVRGGGSGADLRAFNDEGVARAIAGAPVPIVVGIGHEMDRSVADEVAAFSLKTPTSCAAFFVERVDEVSRTLAARATELERLARGRLAAASQGVGWRTARLGSLPERTLERETARLQASERMLRRVSRRSHRRELERIARHRQRLARSATRSLARNELLVQRVRAATTSRFVYRLEREASMVRGRTELVRARDPMRALQRGFALVHAADGTLIKSTRSVQPGDGLIVTVADGSIGVDVTEAQRRAHPPIVDIGASGF